MTVGRKLGVGFATMAVLALILGAYSLRMLCSLNDLESEIATRQAAKLEMAGLLSTTARRLAVEHQALLLSAHSQDRAGVEAAAQRFQAAVSDMRKLLAEMVPLAKTEAGKQGLAAIQDRLSVWMPLEEETLRLCREGQAADAQKLSAEKLQSMAGDIGLVSDKVAAAAKSYFGTIDDAFNGMASRAIWIIAVMVGLCLVAGGVTLAVVRKATGSLRAMAGELSRGADQVAGAASQMASSSQSLAQGASEQAAALEQTSASSEEIHSMARKNTDSSRVSSELVSKSNQAALEADKSLRRMVTSMNEIAASSDKIARIIKVIDEIAFQTNILALNAAVEAARAGEAGMGFAVVADEVRNLAQRSAQAAKDTAVLIEESIAKAGDGKLKVDQVAEAIRGVADLSGRVVSLVDEVRLGSEEQAKGIEQVARAIAQMEHVTQRTAASSEEGAAAAQTLTALSTAMKKTVDRLTVMVGSSE